jgi:hypothetical protein
LRHSHSPSPSNLNSRRNSRHSRSPPSIRGRSLTRGNIFWLKLLYLYLISLLNFIILIGNESNLNRNSHRNLRHSHSPSPSNLNSRRNSRHSRSPPSIRGRSLIRGNIFWLKLLYLYLISL